MSYLSNTVCKVSWFCSDDPVNHITELDLSTGQVLMRTAQVIHLLLREQIPTSHLEQHQPAQNSTAGHSAVIPYS